MGISGQISEIFESIQGEGLYLGNRQAFVRFYGCNLDCKFCDTRPSSFLEYSSPQIAKEIERFSQFDYVSITGGEPLMQSAFLQELLARLKERKHRIYLETNGTLVEELKSVIDLVDIIAMDFKLPSSTGQESYFTQHREFLKLARAKEVFVKAVISDSTVSDDLDITVKIIKAIDKAIPLILQPDTRQLSYGLFRTMADFRTSALEQLENVRIVPQMHKLVGVK